MSKILEMRQKRAEVWDKARAFLDERTNERRGFPAVRADGAGGSRSRPYH